MNKENSSKWNLVECLLLTPISNSLPRVKIRLSCSENIKFSFTSSPCCAMFIKALARCLMSIVSRTPIAKSIGRMRMVLKSKNERWEVTRGTVLKTRA